MPMTEKDVREALDALTAEYTKDGLEPDAASAQAAEFLRMSLSDIAAKDADVSLILREVTGVGRETGETGLRGVAMAAPMLGGVLGGAAGEAAAASPGIARAVSKAPGALRYIGRRLTEVAPTIGEMGGIAAGDVAGRVIAGMPQDPLTTTSTALAGGAIGLGYRGMTRGLARAGDVPTQATMDVAKPTYGVLPSLQKIARPSPRTRGEYMAGMSAERNILPRVWRAIDRAAEKSPARLEKEAFMFQAEADGIRIIPRPVIQKLKELRNKRFGLGAAEGNAEAVGIIDNFIDRTSKLARDRGGSFTPSEWDAFVRHDLGRQAYTFQGAERGTQLAAVFREARNVGAETFRKQVLPKEKWALDKKITDHIFHGDEAEFYFGQDRRSALSKIRSIGKPGNENVMESLNWLSKNFDKGLQRSVDSLSTRRLYTTDIRGEMGSAGMGRGGGILKAATETAGQFMAPFQHHVGPIAAPFVGPRARPLAEQAMKQVPGQAEDLLQSIMGLIPQPGSLRPGR